jgi:hypothetical protein
VSALLVVFLVATGWPMAARRDVIDSRIIRVDAIYDVDIAVNRPQKLRFPVPCREAYAPDQTVEAKPSKSDPREVEVWANPNVPAGFVTTATVTCADGLVVGLRLKVIEESKIRDLSPYINFRFANDEDTLVSRAAAEATAAAESRCKKDLASLTAKHAREQMQAIVTMAQQAFVQNFDREHGRNGYVTVHVDSEKRLGRLKIIEFRVHNGETGPIHVDDLAVQGIGSPQAAMIVELSQTLPEATLDDANAGNLAETPDAVAQISQTMLAPGITARGSVAFMWADDVSRFSLVVGVRAPGRRDVLINNIDF